MKNRAKCKLCLSIIESFHDLDYVTCNCGHISVSGGSRLECSAENWSNFVRVDEKGNEIIVKVVDPDELIDDVKPLYNESISKEDKLKMLEEMIKSYESLPPQALSTPITHYDFLSALVLFSSILRS